MSPLYGPDTRYAFAERDGRIDYAIGNAGFVERRFTERPWRSLADSERVAATLARLPSERNLELLIDPSALLSIVGPFLGMAGPPSTKQLAPIGTSATFSQHPARIDIHLPVETLTSLAPRQSD